LTPQCEWAIAAACARNWSSADEHHRTAIHQPDTAPYRVAQPVTRAWYAEMLQSRSNPGDHDQAQVLLAQVLEPDTEGVFFALAHDPPSPLRLL